MSKKLIKITDKFTDETLFETECECVEMAVKQSVRLNLSDLQGVDLDWVKLEVVELRGGQIFMRLSFWGRIFKRLSLGR